MTSNLPKRENGYKAPSPMNLSREVWDGTMGDIDGRLNVLETQFTDFETVKQEFETQALTLMSETITTEFEARRADLVQLDTDIDGLRGEAEAFVADAEAVLVDIAERLDPADLMGDVTLDMILTARSGMINPALNFSRATSGTYFDAQGVLRTALADEPRFDHDPITGECRGLLIEGQSTNLALWSEDFSNGVWLKIGTSISASTVVAPDGAFASKLAESSASSEHYIEQSHSAINGKNCHTIKAKAGERSLLYLRPVHVGESGSTTSATFNLATGELTATAGALLDSASIVALGDGWYQCSISVETTGVATTNRVRVHVLNDDGQLSYQGDGTSGLYIWGAQLEAQSFPSSYIKTEATAVTRAADNYQISDLGWYDQRGGTIYCEFDLSDLAPSGTNAVLHLGNSANDKRIAMRQGDVIRGADLFIQDQAVVKCDSPSFGIPLTTKNKVAIRFADGDFALSINGAVITAPALGDGKIPTGLEFLKPLSGCSGHIKRMIYSRTRVPNATLEAITS